MGALSVEKGSDSIIMVAGVGGAGGNAVKHMYEMGIEGVEFLICNTDQQSLDKSPIENKIQLGHDGLGAGNDPEEGRRAAIESLEAIKTHLKASKTKMLFITAGMGGGTGTGASPVIAKLAKEMGLLTVAIVTSPLSVEGNERYSQAIQGIDNLREYVDSLLIINNDNVITQYKKLSLFEAFRKADDILCSAAKGIAEIITVKSEFVNVDFADVRRVMTGSGSAHMSVADAEGENRAMEVAEKSLKSPLLDHNLISGAKNILINFSTSEEESLTTDELNIILTYIQTHATQEDANGKRHTANIIWGTSTKQSLDKRLELVVVATGFGERSSEMLSPDETFTPATATEEPTAEEPTVEPTPAPAPRPIINQPPKQVVLEARESRYANIDKILSEPAYKTRQTKMITKDVQGGKREIFRENEGVEGEKAEDVSLFGEGSTQA